MLAIIISFDSLPCAALGCYGNEWIDTPHVDRLAAEGFVFDAHVAAAVNDVNDPFGPPAGWGEIARQLNGLHLLRESDARSPWPQTMSTGAVLVDGSRNGMSSPRLWPFAKLIQAARENCADLASGSVLKDSERRDLLWLHSAGVPLPCLVPPDVESLYIDEFADRSIDWSRLSPDERACHPAVQAAYVTCLDHFLGELMTAIEPVGAVRPVLLTVVACYGGFWRTIPRRCALPSEQQAQRLRGPSIWWSGPCAASRTILPGRSPALVQPFDLLPTLAEWFERPNGRSGSDCSLWPLLEGAQQRVREVAVLPGGVVWTEQDVTVLTQPRSGDPATVRYFLWPEDLWQANDLSSQRPETAAERVRTYSQTVLRERPGEALSSQ